jgi:hypothetical protein
MDDKLTNLTQILGEIVAECYLLREEYQQFKIIDPITFQRNLIKASNKIIEQEKFTNSN